MDAAGAAPAGRGFALDPRVSASQDDLQVYYHEVTEIESIECSTSLALTRVVSSMLFETPEHDPLIFVAVPALLIGVACAASLAPAIKAARVDPAIALRLE